MEAILLKLSDCKPGFIQEFCIRQGEMIFFSNEEPSIPCRNIAVKIADSDFPDGSTEFREETGLKTGVVIICSRLFPEGDWGYVWCSNQTKMVISEFLLKLVKEGKWQYNKCGYLSFIDMRLMTEEQFKEFSKSLIDESTNNHTNSSSSDSDS